MRKVPTVFISSVIQDLEKCRNLIYKIVTEEFKWECIAAKITDEYFHGAPRHACLSGVDRSDLYIGIVKERVGSLVIPYNVYFTELEFYHAVNSRKPLRKKPLFFILEKKVGSNLYFYRELELKCKEQISMYLNFTFTEVSTPYSLKIFQNLWYNLYIKMKSEELLDRYLRR